MLSEKVILDEPFIWNASKVSHNLIQLSKVSNQQIFLIGKDAERLTEYFRQINEDEIRAIDLLSNVSPFSRFGSIDLMFLNLN